MTSNINSKIGVDSIQYTGSILKNSLILDHCTIGNYSRIYDSKLNDFVRVDRNNFVLESEIGAYSYTGQFTVIMHTKIGKFCSISWGTTIGAGEHDYSKITTHDFLYNDNYGINRSYVAYDRFLQEMVIGNDVWVGTNVTINRGVRIGDGAVIGANSVVTHDVPPYAIVVGCPAKVIKFRFDDETVEKLLKLKWWDLPREKLIDHFELFNSEDINVAIDKLKRI